MMEVDWEEPASKSSSSSSSSESEESDSENERIEVERMELLKKIDKIEKHGPKQVLKSRVEIQQNEYLLNNPEDINMQTESESKERNL